MNDDKQEAIQDLQSSFKQKRASFSPGEEVVLRALLLDESAPTTSVAQASRKLNEEMLFSLPFETKDGNEKKPKEDNEKELKEAEKDAKQPPAPTRLMHNHIGLWSAFADGVRPKVLAREGSKGRKKTSGVEPEEKRENAEEEEPKKEVDDEDDNSIRSDVEVRPDNKDDQSETSSWAEKDSAPNHYDAWEVLKDEYANDFGYDYKPDHLLTPEDLDEDDNHYFTILGTSADDKSAHPHALSPPLMDSLMTFLPESITNQNFWLKYSMVRDGASLSTLRRYVRGAPKTIIAIETTDGQVFGSFTSDYWRTERSSFFGSSGDSFLWRMRHSRNSKCASLFEQAQMETEIDVYFYANENDMIQLCTEDRLAVGGGELAAEGESVEQRSQHFGFGLSIDEYMRNGTSSPCATYRNNCLVDGGTKGRTFQIVNLEVWTLTPCLSVDDAEKLEMTQFFIHQSTRDITSTHSIPSSAGRSSRSRSSKSVDFDVEDFSQDKFYRRVGENDESEQQREIWQYAKMMDTAAK
jgi:hypothetical protein